MPANPGDREEGVPLAPLTMRAAAARTRAPELLTATIDDYLLPPEARIDDRDRAAIDATLARCAGVVERSILRHAALILRDRSEKALVTALATPAPAAIERLSASKLLRDGDFMREVIARSRTAVLAAALPLGPQADSQPSLVPALSDDPDPVVAAGARALLSAIERRGPYDDAPAGGTGLPAELHHRLTWWVAAVIRERVAAASDALDAALAEAALRTLGEHDEGERVEAAAIRLAALLGARALPPLLAQAFADRQLPLFLALIARGTGVFYEDARDALIDGRGDRLWLMLRALDCPRELVARIGLALAEADGRRDLEAFAGSLDEISAVAPDTARAALAPDRAA